MVRQFDRETPASELVTLFTPQIKGSVILVTGVSSGGLGNHFVQAIAAASPALIVITGRNLAKVQAVADSIPDANVRVLELDLASLANVRKAAETVNSWEDVPAIDVLVNNAGLMAVPYATTEEGLEMHFGANHIGPFLFTNLIIRKVLASTLKRVVSVTSDGHRVSAMRWDDIGFDDGKTYNKWQAYGQSKTANMLFAVSLAEKLGDKGLTAVSVHPGQIGNTGLGAHLDWAVEFDSMTEVDRMMGNKEGWWKTFPWKEPEQGVATHVFGAYAPDLTEVNGSYLQDSRVADPFVDHVRPWGTSKIEAERLWKLSEKLVGEEFPY